jgi:putative addiction module component (TIGR02574 family)
MSQTIKSFDFLQLSAAERILLAQELWDSVHDEAQAMPLTAAQREELNRRLAQLESGEVKGVPWEQVRKSLMPNS